MPNNPFQNLPQGWEVKTLGEIAITTSGGTPSRKNMDYWNGNIKWLKSGELNDDYIKDSGESITQKGLDNSSAKIFQKGTLLIALYGATIGKLGILDIDLSTNQAICGIIPLQENCLETRYLFYYLFSLRKKMLQDAFGGAQLNISQSYLRGIQIPLPPLETQQKIVAKLESEFAKIEAAKSHLEKVKETIPRLKNALLKSAFSGELTCQKMSDSTSAIAIAPPNTESNAQTPNFPQTPNIGGATLVAQNLQDCTNPPNCHFEHSEESQRYSDNTQYDKKHNLPQGWEVKTLGEITNYGKTTQRQPKDLKLDDWILELEDIKKESGILLNKIAFKDRQSKSNKTIFHKGNVLFGTLRPYLKKVIIADDDGYCSSEIMPFDSGNEITNHYLAYLFLSDFMGNKIAMLTYGTRMPRLGTKNGKELPVPLPPLQTQKQIVEILDSKFATLENLEKETNASLEKLHKLKSSLLNLAFKGELIC